MRSEQIAGRLVIDSVADSKMRQEDALAAEGYQFYAREAVEFAEAGRSAVPEALTWGWRDDLFPSSVLVGRLR